MTVAQGGNTKVGGKRDLENILHIRDLLEREAYAEAYAFLDGGKAKGGSSTTSQNNNIKTNNVIKGGRIGNGNNLYMGTSIGIKSGGVTGGAGGINTGTGGAGGSLSVPISVPMPARRWLEERDAELDAYLYERDLYERDAYAEADPFLNGGGASGGNSRTGQNNNINTKTGLNKVNIGNGNAIQMGTSIGIKSGPVKGGNGGANGGNGGGGGSLSVPLSIPMPMRVRRWLEERDAELDDFHYYEKRDAFPEFEETYLYAREAYPDAYAEAEAEAEADAEADAWADYEAELYARDAYLDEYEY